MQAQRQPQIHDLDDLATQLEGQGGIEGMAKLEIATLMGSDIRRSFREALSSARLNEHELADTSDDPRVLKLLAALAANVEIRQRVAQNRNTPPEILDALAKDKEFEVVLNVAYNPNTSKETLKNLAVDQDMRIREAVACNASAADYHQQLLEYGFLHNVTGILHRLSYSSKDPNILRQLADSDNSTVLVSLAANPSTPYDILLKLKRG